MFTFTILVLVVVSMSRTSAQTSSGSSTNGLGALYTMSNDINNNQIIVYRINSNGKLNYSGIYNTLERGENSSSSSLNYGKITRRAIQVYSNCLFFINPGSNSLSMFRINTSDATILTSLPTQSVRGQYPISVAVSSLYACVITADSTAEVISCFTYSNTSGLSSIASYDLIPYLNKTFNYTPPYWYPSDILFASDSRTLIVSSSGQSPQIMFLQVSSTSVSLIGNFSIPIINPMALSLASLGTNVLLVMTNSTTYLAWYSIVNAVVTFQWVSKPVYSPINCLTYSPTTDSYYGFQTKSLIVPIKANLIPQTNLLEIMQPVGITPTCFTSGPTDATIVTINGVDYMYAIDSSYPSISSYQLPMANSLNYTCYIPYPLNSTTLTQMKGIAAYIQVPVTSIPSSTTRPILSSVVLILIFSIYAS